MDKKYKLILLNNQTHAHYSLSINRILGYCFLLLICILIFFLGFGIFRFIKPHAKQEQINAMYAYKRDMNNLLIDFQKNNMIDSTIVNNYLIPNNLPVEGLVTKGVNKKKNTST